MGRPLKLASLVPLLVIAGSLHGTWACGRIADEAGADGGTQDGTLGAPGDVIVVEASRMDATPDSTRDVADVGVDAQSGPEAGDSGPEPPSCAPGGEGMTNCGPGGSGSESCCTSLEVTGGTYYRTYDTPYYDTDAGEFVDPPLAADGGPTGEADPATVSGFRLDEYLVTVARFRQFVAARKNG